MMAGEYELEIVLVDDGSRDGTWNLLDDCFSGVLESRDEMVEGLKQSYPVYQRLGLGSVSYELVDANHLL